MTGPDWVVLTAPTDRGADPGTALAGALEVLAARHRQVRFTVAVLGGAGDTVTAALDAAARAGARQVLVLSAQTVTDRAMDAWFRRVIGHWLRTRPGGDPTPQVRIGAALTATAGFADLIEAALAGPSQPASARTAPLTSPAWEQVPGFARHVLVCRGPRCSARGGAETQAALAAGLRERGLGDDQVLVTVTGCMFPCGQAPVLAVYPDDTWYRAVTAEKVAPIIDGHLVGGRPVTDWLGARRGR